MSEAPERRGPRLLWTLLGALILVSILPLVISHVNAIRINRESLETLEKKYLTRSAVSIAGDFQNLVDSYVQQMGKVAAGVQNSGVAVGGGDPFLAATQTGVIQSYMAEDRDLLALRILNRDGQGGERVPSGLGEEIVAELNAGVMRTQTGGIYVGNFQYIASMNQPAIVVAVPVGAPGQVIGTVEALVSLRRISERVHDEGKGEVAAFIVDRAGRVLIHSEPSINVQRPDFSKLKIVQEFMKAPVRITESYTDSVSRPGVKMLGTVAPVNILPDPKAQPNWGVVVQKEEARAFASVDRMIRTTVSWAAIALVLAIVVGVVFAAGITKPVRMLVEKTREIAAGKYDQRVELKSRNEIGDLAHNFNVMSEEIQAAVEQLKKAAHENQLLFINSVRMLAAAIDAKDPYTRGHSERVARYSMAIGKHLSLPGDEMRNLRISALLHDVGKIGIDDRILRKPGALSDEEFEVMKGHPEKGAAIMGGVAQLIDIIPGMKYHHEKWSGGGYPEGLVGEDIPMQARIIAIADTFDAMTTNRPYQKAMELNYVVEKIASFGGSRFDPKVVQAFVRAVKSGDVQVEEQVRGAA